MTVATKEAKRLRHAESQRKYRKKLRRMGFKKVELLIPPDLWRTLKPALSKYGTHKRPAQAIIKLLGNIRFKPKE